MTKDMHTFIAGSKEAGHRLCSTLGLYKLSCEYESSSDFLKICLFALGERKRDTENNLPVTGSLSKWPQSWEWGASAGSPPWVQDSRPLAMLHCFPRPLGGNWITSGAAAHKLELIWGAAAAGGRLDWWATVSDFFKLQIMIQLIWDRARDSESHYFQHVPRWLLSVPVKDHFLSS